MFEFSVEAIPLMQNIFASLWSFSLSDLWKMLKNIVVHKLIFTFTQRLNS
jgi:hypothetical protein